MPQYAMPQSAKIRSSVFLKNPATCVRQKLGDKTTRGDLKGAKKVKISTPENSPPRSVQVRLKAQIPYPVFDRQDQSDSESLVESSQKSSDSDVLVESSQKSSDSDVLVESSQEWSDSDVLVEVSQGRSESESSVEDSKEWSESELALWNSGQYSETPSKRNRISEISRSFPEQTRRQIAGTSNPIPGSQTMEKISKEEAKRFWHAYNFSVSEGLKKKVLKYTDGEASIKAGKYLPGDFSLRVVGELKTNRAERIKKKLDTASAATRRLFTGKKSARQLCDDTVRSAVYEEYMVGAAAKSGMYFAEAAGAGLGAASEVASAVLPATLLHGGFMVSNALDVAGGQRQALRMLLKHGQSALRYFLSPDVCSVEDAEAYRIFTANAKKIPALNQAARWDKSRADTAAVRDTTFVPASNSLGLASTMPDVVGSVADGLFTAGGVNSGITAELERRQGMKEYKKGKLQQKAAKGKQKALDKWVTKNFTGSEEEVDLFKQLCKGLGIQMLRVGRQGKLEEILAILRLFKGAVNASVSAASIGIGVASLAGVTVAASGGFALIAFAAAATAAFAGGNTVRCVKRARAAHNARNRQREAQIVIATTPIEELIEAFFRNEKRTVVVGRGVFNESMGQHGFEGGKEKVVDLAANEFINTHIQAYLLSKFSDPSIRPGEPEHERALQAFSLLKLFGMGELELRAMLLVAQQTPEADRVEYIKKCICPVYGITFTTDPRTGSQKTAPRSTYYYAFREMLKAEGLMHPYRAEANNDFDELSETLFKRVDRRKFIEAIEEINASRVASPKEIEHLHNLENATSSESASHKKINPEIRSEHSRYLEIATDFAKKTRIKMNVEIQKFGRMNTAERNDLEKTLGLSAAEMRAFQHYAAVRQGISRADPTAAAHMPHVIAFAQKWRGAVSDGSLDRSKAGWLRWQRTINELVAELPPPLSID